MISDRITQIDQRIQEIHNRFQPRPPVEPTSNTSSASESAKAAVSAEKPVLFSGMLEQLIQEESKKQGVSPDLVRAVVKAESNGNPKAVSPKGAIGLMQLMPQTAEMLGVDPHDPSENLEGGIRFLKQMAGRYGDLDRTLAAYNAGPGAVDRFKGVPPFEETQQYIKKIKKTLNSLQQP
ncbi:MAG: lytic transglycosylase domain-containing protein [Leptonema illini]|uniref:Lytic transglycosylase domain-containing protein n=1 Tax=Leptonema illini TaxID=183 RepID=A0A833H4Z2_9LEPT|nr:MAG: lytic transglycosylase domain-containing protein [Leptonema illini]